MLLDVPSIPNQWRVQCCIHSSHGLVSTRTRLQPFLFPCQSRWRSAPANKYLKCILGERVGYQAVAPVANSLSEDTRQVLLNGAELNGLRYGNKKDNRRVSGSESVFRGCGVDTAVCSLLIVDLGHA